MEYAFDTNIIIHFIKGTHSVLKNRDIAVLYNARFIIPPFVNYEIRRGLMIQPVPKRLLAYDLICKDCAVEEMTTVCWLNAADIYVDLYLKHLTVSDSDIIIAAFCLVNGYTLVTDNIKDYKNISGLKYTNWID